MNCQNHVQWIPSVDQSPKSTYVGRTNNYVASSRIQGNQPCVNPYGAYCCPITLCKCERLNCPNCNKEIGARWKRRYVNIKWNQY